MSQKIVYYSVETALMETSREDWPTSSMVSRALLGCVRIRGIVRQHMMKRGVDLENLDDVISEIAVVMQMKMVHKLEQPKDVYFVIFRVSQLVVSNFGKKSINTSHSDEISLSSLLGPEDDENDALERLSSESTINSQDDENERRIDLENAKARFVAKLASVGWPSDIKRERTRMGRPPKQNPIIAVAA